MENFMKNNRNILGVIVFFAVTMSIFLYTCTSSSSPQPPQGPTLDETIQQAAEKIGNNLKSNVKVAMLNFTSTSIAFSEYVLDELGGALVNTKRVSVVDRRELDLIRQEEKFQLSGEVSDESMVSIGKKLGAQMIVSGSLRNMGEENRFTARILNVETAQVEAFFSTDMSRRDKRTSYLLSVRDPAPPAPPLPPAQIQPTAEKPYKPLSGLQNAIVIGTVQTRFEVKTYDFSISRVNERSYSELLEVARREYKGVIDIVDITWVENGFKPGSSYDKIYSASGKVVTVK
jgi:TolB-like protein